jgi:cation transport ATPase
MFVAVVALVAAPLNVAVIVPAEKLPLESRATTLEAVFASVASTAKVRAVAPLYVPPLVRYVPAVNALATEPAWPAMFPETAEPLIAIAVLVITVACPCAFTVMTGTDEAEP